MNVELEVVFEPFGAVGDVLNIIDLVLTEYSLLVNQTEGGELRAKIINGILVFIMQLVKKRF